MSFADGIRTRLLTVEELITFLWRRRLWWLIPLAATLVLLALFLVFAQASGVGRFIYPFF